MLQGNSAGSCTERTKQHVGNVVQQIESHCAQLICLNRFSYPGQTLQYRRGAGGGGQSYKKDEGTRHTFNCYKSGLGALRVFSFKRSTVGAYAVPLRVLSRKNMTGNNVLC